MLENLQIDLLIIIFVTICIDAFHYFTQYLFLLNMWHLYSDLNLVKKVMTGEACIFYTIPFLFYISLEAIAIFIFSDKLSIADIIFTGLFPQIGVWVLLQMQMYFTNLKNAKSKNIIHIGKTDTIDFSNYQEGNIYIVDYDIVDDLNYFKEFFKYLVSIDYILGTTVLITGGLLGKFSHTLYNLL
jgi:hypothetical protein